MTSSSDESLETAECPFPDCDWSREYDPEKYHEEHDPLEDESAAYAFKEP